MITGSPAGKRRQTSLHFRQYAGSNAEGECLRHLACFPFWRIFKRLKRPRLVEVEHRIELIGEPGLKVMTLSLRIGPVNDANGALKRGSRKSSGAAPVMISRKREGCRA
jgi:hypothetical protein